MPTLFRLYIPRSTSCQALKTVHLQVEKVHYVEALGSRVNMIEAERQQSEARVKEEVGKSLGQKMGVVDQVG